MTTIGLALLTRTVLPRLPSRHQYCPASDKLAPSSRLTSLDVLCAIQDARVEESYDILTRDAFCASERQGRGASASPQRSITIDLAVTHTAAL